MPGKVSVPYHVIAAGGAAATVSIFRVPSARKLKVNKVTVAFPVGTYGELEVALYFGIRRVFPQGRNITGDNMSFEKDVNLTWFSGDHVLLYYKNNNATQTREAYVNLEGVFE